MTGDQGSGPFPTDDLGDVTAIERVRARWAAYQLSFEPVADGMWQAPCPRHRIEHMIVIEEGAGPDDPVTVNPCPGGCLPEEIMAIVGLNGHAEAPRAWTRARERITLARFGTTDVAGRYGRVIAALVERGCAGRRSDIGGIKGEGRYQCPACGAPGDGHGLKVAVGDSEPVVLHCFQGCDRGDILAALGLTQTDISRPRPELTELVVKDANGDPGPAHIGLHFVSLDEFIAVEEEGTASLLGADGQALIGEGTDTVIYGDGGAGKTTLTFDLTMHWRAGDNWLGITVARPLNVTIIEDEGPRPLLRAKLERKVNGWEGSDLVGAASILEEPWAQFTFAYEQHRRQLAEHIRDTETDAVIVGPVVMLGMEGHGTLIEVRAFLKLCDDVRKQSGRRVAFILVHHENRIGTISGAWEGAVDTVLHVKGLGHGKTRLHVQKARHSSELHGQTFTLSWADNESYQVEDKPELTDTDIIEQILAAVAEHPGTSWGAVDKAVKGVSADRKRAVRDQMLAVDSLVNIGKVNGADTWLTVCPPRKTARLYITSDPAIRHLRPDPDAAGTQMDFTASDQDAT
jgi:hypothetical protein